MKPFSPRELMARLNVIIGRHGGGAPARIRVGEIEIDAPAHNVYVAGERVELTAKEYDVLLCLAENKGIVLSRAQILSAVWGYDIAHVWDRYFTRSQPKRNAKGSGLGLAISREILEANGANYGADSETGHGATFWFEIPGNRATSRQSSC